MCTVQTLYPEGGAMHRHDNAPERTARLETEWFDEHERKVETLFEYFGEASQKAFSSTSITW